MIRERGRQRSGAKWLESLSHLWAIVVRMYTFFNVEHSVFSLYFMTLDCLHPQFEVELLLVNRFFFLTVAANSFVSQSFATVSEQKSLKNLLTAQQIFSTEIIQ